MKYSIILFLMLLGLRGTAQIQFHSFKEVLKYADDHAFAIQSAKIGEQIAVSEKKEAGADLFPSINPSFGYTDNITLQPALVPAQIFNPEAPDGAFEELTFGTKYNYAASLQVQWDVLNFQKIFALQTANTATESSKIKTEINRFKTYNQLASTYYSILLTQESIRIYEENVDVSASIYEHAQEKYQQGIISEADLNRAKIQQRQNQRNLKNAKNNLEQFYLQFQSQLNTNEPITITDAPQNFELEHTAIQNRHPEVLLQEAEVLKYQSIVKQTKAIRYPSLSLVYQNNRNWATNDFMGFSNANELPQQFFGVQLNLSGLLSPSTKQKINQSKGNLQIQQLQLENTILVKQQEDELLQLQLKQAADQLAENKEILALQKQNDVHAENKYQSELISLDDRLNKYGDLLAVQDNYLQSLAAYTLAQYKIYIRQIDFKAN